ncbi:TVP38/TMEM64 family protein [Streptomyces sp. CA2R106]|uniref:TVP38/TMEM64 family protein n=1 Tax=Streptomyces sp. CA2R106 TaxID=3120153 RepID=UPI003FA729CA
MAKPGADLTPEPPGPRARGIRDVRELRDLRGLRRAAARTLVRCSRGMMAPWTRFGLLVAVLAAGIALVLAWHPQQLLTHGWPPRTSGATAVLVFAVAYGVATVVFVPRPLLNAAAGALYGIHAGLPAAIGGTVLGAGLAFLLGRFLGRDAVRPLLRGRFVLSLDRQLSRHGFRSTLALRLFPGVPFAAANYAAALSRIRLAPFLTATAAGSAANTAAYVVAGARAASPTSPAFLLALGFLGVTAVAATAFARRRTRGAPAPADGLGDALGDGLGKWPDEAPGDEPCEVSGPADAATPPAESA